MLDGRPVSVEPVEGAGASGLGTLLEVLRDRLGVRSVKDGCSPQGQCGCCTVWVDGQARVSCVTPLSRVRGRHVTTVDGLAPEVAHRWSEALCATGGSQCGFCTPGIEPLDSTFATPVFGNLGDQRVMYAGTGCGNIVCVNVRTGEPVWRFRLSQSGVNADILLAGPGKLIGIHGKENVDATHHGRLVALNIPTEYPKGPKPVVLGKFEFAAGTHSLTLSRTVGLLSRAPRHHSAG